MSGGIFIFIFRKEKCRLPQYPYFLKNKNQYDLQQAEKEGLTTGKNMSSLNTSYNKKEEEK